MQWMLLFRGAILYWWQIGQNYGAGVEGGGVAFVARTRGSHSQALWGSLALNPLIRHVVRDVTSARDSFCSRANVALWRMEGVCSVTRRGKCLLLSSLDDFQERWLSKKRWNVSFSRPHFAAFAGSTAKPEILFQPQDTVVTTRTFTVFCIKSKGTTVTWYHDGQEVDFRSHLDYRITADGSLHVTNALRSRDEGSYMCSLAGSQGRRVNSRVAIIKFPCKSTNLSQSEMYGATTACRADLTGHLYFWLGSAARRFAKQLLLVGVVVTFEKLRAMARIHCSANFAAT